MQHRFYHCLCISSFVYTLYITQHHRGHKYIQHLSKAMMFTYNYLSVSVNDRFLQFNWFYLYSTKSQIKSPEVALYYKYIALPYLRENSKNQLIPCDSHLATAERKNSVLSGGSLRGQQAKGGAAIHHHLFRVNGTRKEKEEENKVHSIGKRRWKVMTSSSDVQTPGGWKGRMRRKTPLAARGCCTITKWWFRISWSSLNYKIMTAEGSASRSTLRSSMNHNYTCSVRGKCSLRIVWGGFNRYF